MKSLQFNLARTAALALIATGLGAGLALGSGASPAAAVAVVEKVADGGFEANTGNPVTNSSWTATNSRNQNVLCTVAACGQFAGATPRTGNGWARFVTRSTDQGASTASIRQSVVIPASPGASLTYYYRHGASSLPYNATLTVKVDSVVVRTHYQASTSDPGYSLQSVPLQQFADGQSHMLSFEYAKPAASETWMSIDDVSIADRGVRVAKGFSTGVSAVWSVTSTLGTFSASTDLADASALTAVATGLPAGLTIVPTSQTAAGVRPSTTTWSITGKTLVAPGTYPGSVDVSDGQTHQAITFNVTVGKKMTTAKYSGPTTVMAPAMGNDIVDLGLSAYLTEPANYMEYNDFTLATATFKDTTTGETLCSTPFTAAGTASCAYLADSPRTYQVQVIVTSDYYLSLGGSTRVQVTFP
ncbi:MAG TPA: hypothetical protein PLZ93_14675 [Nocardioides sp.]|uniref:hypothetical protein n=1 Tax=uncultured Nocardioides sp. TaxID=198441 RepID=UPI000EBD2CC2|nr:hypothetical protein [uncultured Nocardioides sp.]HCB07387.1 hypothetical protein [Nocardioides sp.]HRD63218.1 hypothetical protein [Nocardioides sp.]HRI96858.1 hypothetical protein [Nocardioides sp.]HRK46526.1 hypothetical protein [Nocardioides sp.]